MKVKVLYDQEHLNIVIFWIDRRCQAAIPIFDILIGFGVIVERLNPHVKIFRFWGCFSTLLALTDKIQNSKLFYHLMISVSKVLVKIWLKSVRQILRFVGWIKKIINRSKRKDCARALRS